MNICQIALNPKDLLIAMEMAFGVRKAPWTYQSMAEVLGLSPSQVHASVRRLLLSGLLTGKGLQGTVQREALAELIVRGARYVFPPVFGKVVRGVPAGASSAFFKARDTEGELPAVWPFADGEARGIGLAPLHPCVPGASLRDPALHEALVHFDVLRTGNAREREVAAAFFMGVAPGLSERVPAVSLSPSPSLPSWKAW